MLLQRWILYCLIYDVAWLRFDEAVQILLHCSLQFFVHLFSCYWLKKTLQKYSFFFVLLSFFIKHLNFTFFWLICWFISMMCKGLVKSVLHYHKKYTFIRKTHRQSSAGYYQSFWSNNHLIGIGRFIRWHYSSLAQSHTGNVFLFFNYKKSSFCNIIRKGGMYIDII